MSFIFDRPVGAISMYPGAMDKIIPGWRLCNGSFVNKEELVPEDYQKLAEVLGQAPESENLKLPDLSDRFPVGAGSDASLREAAGPDRHRHGHHFKQTFLSGPAPSTIQVKGKAVLKKTLRLDWRQIAVPQKFNFTGKVYPANKKVLLSKDFTKESTGLNRPGFYALNFIIRVSSELPDSESE